MLATVLHGPGDVRFEDVAEPAILKPTDAIIKLRTSIYPSSAGFGALTAHRKRVTGTLSLGLAPVPGDAA
jgi:hypothetical protein